MDAIQTQDAAVDYITGNRIIVDSREQRPYKFDGAVVKALKTGDYSIEGYEDQIAIERKGFDDLFGCLTSSLPRFRKQLQRLGQVPYSAVLLDTTVSALLMGHPICRLPGDKALSSVLALSLQYGVQFHFCDRRGAEYCSALLHLFLKRVRRPK